ncbi:MAG: hypothetical protein VX589_15400 [Myxococcota bacterium]|nr:hypothetical protein [Myxococcota bacterium]
MLPTSQAIGGFSNLIKGVKENKAGKTCDHFGVNIALGGVGNINPVSGNQVRENGQHGHLSIAKCTVDHGGRSALLVGVEQSAPIERQVAVQDRAGPIKSMLTRPYWSWVPDQYGGGHGVGGNGRCSATGGDDCAYSTAPSKLGAYRPARGHDYDGMYLNLHPRT